MEETLIWTAQAPAWLGEGAKGQASVRLDLLVESATEIEVETPRPEAWKTCERRVEFDADIDLRIGELMHRQLAAHLVVSDSQTTALFRLDELAHEAEGVQTFMSVELEFSHEEGAAPQVQVHGHSRRGHGRGGLSAMSGGSVLLASNGAS